MFHLCAGNVQNRAINSAAPRRNAPRAVRTHAARQVQKQRFGIIVGVVRRGDAPVFPCFLRKARVTHAPRAFLHALAAYGRKRGNILIDHLAVKFKCFTVVLHKFRVAVGFRPPNAMVHMHRKQTLRAVLLYKQIRQQHGIRPAGKPHDNFSRLRQIIPHAGEDVLSFHDAQLPAM